ncbi:Ribonuclease T2 precursor (RNase T2) [Aspergillus tubingensis]|uniref:Ribonuclease T2 family n=1 Tax=Aspergillus costaricaensis CBS 115574 TaxID=1448317 RepID=A0ACD1I4L8_9EURO|nr:ribonuclease T2 family [Aspergillus costaricaensis CBS 115574]RAK84712.1 ribonuclease T2 family [Aspergillus costaricaensis CBS 115574]
MLDTGSTSAVGSTAISMRDRLLQSLPGPQQVLKAITGTLGVSSLSVSDYSSSEATFRQCPSSEVSCKAQYHGQDTCCFNYPGGQMLQTQFWDADPAIGPADSWTIHGLWPDHCNGGFDQYCDSGRRYSNISLILVDSGRGDLLDYMSDFWKDFRGDDANLWEHEWNKHGTCVSTLETHCYTDYYPQQEVVDYFDRTVEVFRTLPTYETLAKAGITPSYTQTYTRDEIVNALSKAHGAEVTVRCRHQAINEVWYYFNIAGPLQTGKFVPSDPDGQTSNCPRSGIHYIPKTPRNGHEPTKTSRGPAEPTAPSAPFSGKGNLMISTNGQKRGCIISHGAWFTSGTCATFTANKASDDTVTLKSSKGDCGFSHDVFTCGGFIRSPTQFTVEDGMLAYNDNTTFFADKAPKGPTKSKVFATQDDHPLELSITWREA